MWPLGHSDNIEPSGSHRWHRIIRRESEKLDRGIGWDGAWAVGLATVRSDAVRAVCSVGRVVDSGNRAADQSGDYRYHIDFYNWSGVVGR